MVSLLMRRFAGTNLNPEFRRSISTTLTWILAYNLTVRIQTDANARQTCTWWCEYHGAWNGNNVKGDILENCAADTTNKDDGVTIQNCYLLRIAVHLSS